VLNEPPTILDDLREKASEYVRLDPWLLATAPLRLWVNPWAAHPIAAALPWGRVTGDLDSNAVFRTEATQPPHELLSLPATWPNSAS
jgi:hypothetical protein